MRWLISIGTRALALFLILGDASSIVAEAAAPSWQAKWNATVQAAKEEGQVRIYGSSVYTQVFGAFQKKYPDIKLTHIPGTGGEISQRIMSERRAGKYLADLYILGAGTGHYLYNANVFDPIRPGLILPEVINESKWWMGKHKYMDDEGKYLLAFNEVALPFIAYNTKLVNSAEFRSYWDLLNPKWKGKMIAFDPMVRAAGDHLVFIMANPELGQSFLRQLFGEMNVAGSRDPRQIVDWLAVGKHSISLFTSPSRAGLLVAKAQGLPIDWLQADLKEGGCTSTTNGTLGLFNGAPHPNAAKVAVNWLLSREGQSEYQKFQQESNSLRIDIPKDNVAPYTHRKTGVSYVGIDNPQWRGKAEEISKLITEIWKKR